MKGVILRPPPNDGAAWRCSEIIEKPKPVWWDNCGEPAVCVIIGTGPRCQAHDPENSTSTG